MTRAVVGRLILKIPVTPCDAHENLGSRRSSSESSSGGKIVDSEWRSSSTSSSSSSSCSSSSSSLDGLPTPRIPRQLHFFVLLFFVVVVELGLAFPLHALPVSSIFRF
jgi:hypothetical protein